MTNTILTTKQRRVLFIALSFVTLLKIFIALSSPDTADAHAFVEFLTYIRRFGATGIYQFRGSYNNIFNFPPQMIYVIKGLGALADRTGLPFRFWLRLLPSLADVGSFFVIWAMLPKRKNFFRILLLLALCPVSILINANEGNLDGLMISFVLLSVFFMVKKNPALAGIAFGLSLSIKFVPFIFIPAIFFYLPNLVSRFKFFGSAFAYFILAALPTLITDPRLLGTMPFGYSSIYGAWGITHLLVRVLGQPTFLHYPYDIVGMHAVLADSLKYFTLVLILAISFVLNRRNQKADLLAQCGLVVSLFLVLTPGFGVQYLVWFVPFVTAADLRATLFYYLTTFLFLALKGPYATPTNVAEILAMYSCWIAVVYGFWKLLSDSLNRTKEPTKIRA